MFQSTAFYHNSPKPDEKGFHWPSTSTEKSDTMKRAPHQNKKFMRLDSLEGACHTYKDSDYSTKMASESVDSKLPPSAQESKWFGRYHQDHQHHFPHPQQSQWSYQPQLYHPVGGHHYQMPFNLNKGQYEIWPMMQQGQSLQPMMTANFVSHSEPAHDFHQGQNYSFSKCVNSLVQWGTQLASSLLMGEFKSTLNPNAKEFTPSLNPNAKEFHPNAKPEVPEEDGQKIAEENVHLKTVQQRKCTPWIPKGSINQQDLDLSDLELPDINDITTEDDDDDDDDDSDVNPRSRLLSVCSSEDGFIQFEESPKVMSKIDKDKVSPFLQDFLASPQDDSDDEDESEDEFEEDDEDSTEIVAIVFEEDDEVLQPKFWVPEFKAKEDAIADEVDFLKVKNKCCDDSYPDTDRTDHEEVLKKIREANLKWNKLESKPERNEIRLTFCEPVVTDVLEEDPEMADDLREARINDCAQRKADQERYNRLLAPIFKEEHRDKIRSYITSYLTST